MASDLCDTLMYLNALQEGVNAFRRVAGEQPTTILKKGFERNIMTVFCKFHLIRKFMLNIAKSSVILKCHWRFMEDIYRNKIETLMTINLNLEGHFLNLLRSLLLSYRKRIGYMMERRYALFV